MNLIALIALAAWIHLAFFRDGFWRASERLGDAPEPESWPAVVAVIPARDEAASIAQIIEAHMAADYPGDYSIVLVDDGSMDGTADIARKAAEGKSRRLEIISAPDLPPGWTGKLWAMHHGLLKAAVLAPDAKHRLLADADIVFASGTLRRLVAKAERENLSLASLMARLDVKGSWASLLIPSFIYFFQKLYPFPRVNDPNDNTAAAAGGCMLARADVLAEIGGVETFKDDIIDDCALARRIKDISPSTKIWIGLADDEVHSLRDNEQFSSVWNMVARTAYAQLGHSATILAGTLFGLAIVYLAPPLIALTFAAHHDGFALILALLAWGLMAYTYWPTLKLYDQEPWQSAVLPVSAALYAAMTFSSALRHWQGKGGQWKGRSY